MDTPVRHSGPQRSHGLCSLPTVEDPTRTDARWMIQEVLCEGNFGGVGGRIGERRQSA